MEVLDTGRAAPPFLRRPQAGLTFGHLCLLAACLFGAMATGTRVWAAEPASKAGVVRPSGARRSMSRLPDWRGAWYLQTGGQFKRGDIAGSSPPELTSAGVTELKRADHAYFDEGINPPLQNCIPDGMPHIMDYAFPMEFYFTPGKIVVYIEAYGQVRWIYTDGRKHPDDLPPSYNGDSIGRWDHDTLVVDTVGMIPETQLVISNNFLGVRHSDQLHLTERMRLTAPDTLQIQTTIDDPVLFAKPWVGVKTYLRKRDPLFEVKEYVCSNNREPLDAEGKQTFQFKAPKP